MPPLQTMTACVTRALHSAVCARTANHALTSPHLRALRAAAGGSVPRQSSVGALLYRSAHSHAHAKGTAHSAPHKPTHTNTQTDATSWQQRHAVFDVKLREPLKLVSGAVLHDVCVRVEVHGTHSLPASRTVIVFPSFSHSSHIASNFDDPSRGWWQDFVGTGKAIDTRRWRVVCVSVLGSPFSGTNPCAHNPDTGRPYRAAFPQVTPTDLALCHRQVLLQIGIDGRVHACIGSSLGGMQYPRVQALQYASLFPDAVERVAAVACTGKSTPFTVAIRHMQRSAILRDPLYHRGDYADRGPGVGPWEGLKLAREMGTLFYRSREEFDTRFEWSPTGDRHFTALDTWEVETYLAYQGNKFVHTYDPNAYLLLSKCMDLQDLGDGYDGRSTYAEGAGRIKADTLLIGVKQDALIPAAELHRLAETIRRAGGSARFEAMDSVFGHDAFLKESAWLGPQIREHLQRGLEKDLAEEEVHNTGSNAP